MLFIDTGAFLARYVEADRHHARAAAAWDKLAKDRAVCATSNFVLDELFTLLGRRAGYAFAAERARNIMGSQSLRVLRSGPKQEMEALALFEKYADQAVSFTDCVSFVLMREARIHRVFGFDGHFERAGFEVWP